MFVTKKSGRISSRPALWFIRVLRPNNSGKLPVYFCVQSPQTTGGKNNMHWKKLLLIALVAVGFAFAATPRSEAGVHVGIGIGLPVGIGYGYGYGYPAYYGGYGYGYPYGYYGAGYSRVVYRPYYHRHHRRVHAVRYRRY